MVGGSLLVSLAEVAPDGEQILHQRQRDNAGLLGDATPVPECLEIPFEVGKEAVRRK